HDILDLFRRQDRLPAPRRAHAIEALHAIIGRHDGRGIEAGRVDETKPKLAFGPAAAGAAKARREVALKLLFRKRSAVTEDAGAAALDLDEYPVLRLINAGLREGVTGRDGVVAGAQ